MSSISELFGDIGLNEGSDAPFDPSKLNSVLDDIMKDRPVAGAPEGYQQPTSTQNKEGGAADGAVPGGDAGAALGLGPDVANRSGDGVDSHDVGRTPPEAPPRSPLPPPATLPDPGLTREPLPVAPDLFSGMSDLEKQELLAIRQAMADPDRQQAVRRAYLGIPDLATPPPPPPAPVKATLPEDVDPESFEAKLWHQNQELQSRLDQLTQGVQQQTQQTEAERAQAAARKVTAEFSARYGDRLSQAEIQAICSTAGAQKLPDAFLPTTGGNVEAAMTKSLEFVLRSDDTLLAKVLGAPAPAPAPAGRTPEAVERTRKLTALSSAASPTGEVPTRQPITHRPDGRLDEQSRQSLIATMMGKLNEGEG